MAENLITHAREARAAAPAGLQQQQEESSSPNLITQSREARSTAGLPKWQTGGQTGSTENGWNTPFYQKMFAQQNEEAAKGASGDPYGRKDYTGVVTQDVDGKKFGDVWEDGKRKGNLYDSYDKFTADQMMAQLTLDPTTQRKVYAQQSNDPEAISKAVQAKREEANKERAGFLTQRQYQADVDAQQKEFQKGAKDEVASVGAGALGGAAVGAGIGGTIGSVVPVIGTAIGAGAGAILGAGLGGWGAFLNRDELTEQAARATVQTRQARDEVGMGAAVPTALKGWGGVLGQTVNPFTNLVHGAVDARGTTGDGVEDYYATDDEGNRKAPGWVQALGVGATLVDAVGQFANPVGAGIFMTSMGAQVAGGVGQLTTGKGYTFDDSTGSFDRIYDRGLAASAAGIGEVAIDAVQMGMGHGLLGKVGQEAKVFNVAGTELRAGEKVALGGRSFRMGENGVMQGGRMTYTAFVAPSEMVQAAGTRVLAMRMTAKQSGALTADDMYRAATQLASGERRLAAAVVNGFGEGAEEAVQQVLNPISHGQSVDPHAIGEAALMGAFTGMGMSLGASARGLTQADKLYSQYSARMQSIGQPVEDRKTWDARSTRDKQRSAVMSPLESELYRAAATKLVDGQKQDSVAAVPMLDAKADAVRAMQDKDLKSLNPRTDTAFVISQTNSTQTQSAHMALFSLEQVDNLFKNVVTGFKEKMSDDKVAADPKLLERATNEHEQAGVLRAAIRDALSRYRKQPDEDGRARTVQAVNQILQDAWSGKASPRETLTPEQVRARQRAVSLMFIRDPQAGIESYQMLLPQVDEMLSETRSNNAMRVSHAILKSIGGDYDGDKMRLQAQEIITDEDFANLRAGINLIGNAPGVNIMVREYEKVTMSHASEAFTKRTYGDPQFEAAQAMLENIRQALHDRYDGVGRITAEDVDRVVDVFHDAVEAHNPEARALLLDQFAQDYSGSIMDHGRQTLTNEWLWIDDLVQTELQAFQTVYAENLRLEMNLSARVNGEAIPQRSGIDRVRAANALTDAYTLGIRVPGQNLFRQFQTIHYSVEWAPVLSETARPTEDLTNELVMFYEQLSNDAVISELRRVQGEDDLVSAVNAQVRHVVESGQADGYTGGIALAANTAVPYALTLDDGTVDVQMGLTLTQAILKRELEKDKAAHAGTADEDREARWKTWERMVLPDSQASPGHAAAAFIEVFGRDSLFEMMGPASSVIGSNLTVEQFVRTLTAKTEHDRAMEKQRLHLVPEYGTGQDRMNAPYTVKRVQEGGITEFKAVVDAALETAARRLSTNEAGLATGEWGDAKGGRSYRTTQDLRSAMEESQEAFKVALRSGGRHVTRDQVMRLMTANAGWARRLLDIVPDSSKNALFQERDGILYVSNWVYDLFTMTPDEAVMHLHRNLMLAEWRARADGHFSKEDSGPADAYAYENLDNRFHQLMFRIRKLDDDGATWAKFMDDWSKETNLDRWMERVNTEYRDVHEPPFVAWMTDVSDFDPNRMPLGGGEFTGSATRTAIRDFATATTQLVRTVREERRAEEADSETVASLLQAINDEQEGKPTTQELRRFREAVTFASTRRTLLGPTAMQQVVVMSQLHFFPKAHTKGISPEAYVPLGEFQALGENAGWITAFEQYEAALTSVSVKDVSANPQSLAGRALRMTDESGRPINWESPSPEALLRLWTENRQARPLLRAILFPSVMDVDASGNLSQQFLVGKSLTELINGGTYQEMLGDDARARTVYSSMVESMAGADGQMFAFTNALNDVLIAQHSSMKNTLTIDQAERAASRANRDMVDILRLVGEIRAQELEAGEADTSVLPSILQEVMDASRTYRLRKLLGLSEDEVQSDLPQKLLDELIEAKKQELLGGIDPAAMTPEQAKAATAAVETSLQEFTRATEQLLERNGFRTVIEQFHINWNDPTDVADTTAAITNVIKSNGSILEKVPGALQELNQLTRALALNPDQIPDLPKDTWDALSRAVIAARISDMTAPVAGNVTALEIPKLPEDDLGRVDFNQESTLRYWDTSYSYLVKPLLDPKSPLVKAATKIHQQAHATTTASTSQLKRRILGTILNPERLGNWTDEVPRVSIQSRERILSSASGSAISMSGSSPVTQATESLATKRTYMLPPEETVTTIQLTGTNLVSDPKSEAHQVPVHVAQAGTGGVDEVMPVMQLNGRFARRVGLTYGGAPITDGEQDNLLYFSGPEAYQDFLKSETVMRSGWKGINVSRLQKAVEHALNRELGITADKIDWSAVGLDVEFLHPDSQPDGAEFFNSVFYEGLSFDLSADSFDSLNASFWFSHGGMSPAKQAQALQANKKGQLALQVSDWPKASTVEQLEAMWNTDFAGMLRAKTMHLMTTDTGGGLVDLHYFNAVYKRMKLRHWVRGIDQESGEPRLLTAEQVIRLQQSGQGEALTGMQLYVPDDDVLRTMLGEQGARGVAGHVGDPLAPVPAFTGDTSVIVKRMPGILEFDDDGFTTGELWSTRAVARAVQRQLVGNGRIDKRLESAMRKGLRIRMERKASIHEARQSEYSKDRWDTLGRNNEQAMQWGREALSTAVNAIDFTRLGIPMVGLNSQESSIVARRVLADAGDALRGGNGSDGDLRTVRILRYGSTEPGTGAVISTVPGTSTPKHLQVAADDIVIVDLASFEALGKTPEAALRNAVREVKKLVDAGAVIVLPDGNTGRDLRAEVGQFLTESNYERINGSAHAFKPRAASELNMNERARVSTLGETYGISGRSMVTSFLSEDLPIAENAAMLVNTAAIRDIAVGVDVVPTNYLGRFNLPVSQYDIDRVKAHVQNMEPSHLHRLMGVQDDSTEAREFDLALKRMIDSWSESGDVLPARIEWGTGDLLPLFDSKTGTVVLYRHGYRMPTESEVLAQAATPVEDGEAGANIAVAKATINPMHTTRRGLLRSWQKDGKYGLRAVLMMSLQDYLDKVQIEGNGMKYTMVPADMKTLDMPQFPMFRNWGIDVVASLQDALSKESLPGMVTSHRNAFAFLGIDFMPDLVKFFTGQDLGALSERSRNAATEQERTDAANKVVALRRVVLDVLDQVRRGPKRSLETADVMMRAMNGQALITQTLSEQGLANVAGLRAEWLDDLLAVDPTPEAQIAYATLVYMSTPQAEVAHVLASGGFNNADSRSSDLESVMMPPLFTNFFDRTALDSPLRLHVNEKLNRQFQHQQGSEGYALLPDWTFVYQGPGGTQHAGHLQFSEAHSSGDNPVLNGMAADRAQTQQYSYHVAATAEQAVGARTVASQDLVRSKRFQDQDALVRLDDHTSLWQVFSGVDTHELPAHMAQTIGEQRYRQAAYKVAGGFRKTLNMAEWEDPKKDEYLKLRESVARNYGIPSSHSWIVDYWVRQMLGTPLSEDGTLGNISVFEALGSLKEVEHNSNRHRLPTYGAEVPQLHWQDLSMLFNLSQDNGTFTLYEGAESDTAVKSVEDWVHVALGVGMEGQLFNSGFRMANDAMLHTYYDAGQAFAGLPISHSDLLSAKLMDEDGERLVLSLDPNVQLALEENPVLGAEQASLTELLNGMQASYRAPSSAIAKRRQIFRRWRKENGVPEERQLTMKNFREIGATYVEESTVASGLLRTLTNLRVANALLNPGLYFSAYLETGIRGLLEDATNLLTGDSTGPLAKVLTNAQERTPQGLQAATEALFGLQQTYSPKQLVKLKHTYQAMASRPEFKSMVYQDTLFQNPRLRNAGRIEMATSKLAGIGSRIQDPTYGMKADTLARRYVESVMAYIADTPTDIVVSPDRLASSLMSDPQWVRKNLPDAHKAAVASIMNARSLKPTPLSLALRGVYEPLSRNPHMLVAVPSTLFLKLPLLFSNYATNVASTTLGLQGVNSFIALALHGRHNPFAKFQSFMAGEEYIAGQDDTFDMSQVIESVDLTKSFVQSGISLTALFAGGMLAGGLGLAGEDDEERRRRRAAKLQGYQYIYDPRQIENDFRNEDAIFLDNLPFGLSSLFAGFGVTTGDSESGYRKMGNLHWMLKQFVSPIMGMERFFQTGDWRQIMWGVEDGLSSFPLINQLMWDDANMVAAELAQAALEQEQLGTPESLPKSFDLWTKLMMTYERMLFENSFVNQLYVGYDDYDRDPWVRPLVDSDGDIQVDAMGNPRKTTAMNDYKDDDGTIKSGYAGYSDVEAKARGMAENRLSFGLFMSLVTGNPTLDSQWLRGNMAVKTRSINKTELSDEEAEGLVLSLYDQTNGGEALTEAGARAVFNGLRMGAVQLGDESLAGVYISYETRQALQKQILAELAQESADMGLSEYQVNARVNQLWYGPKSDPTVAGLTDILWSDQISYSPKQVYNQLNTTYVMGPDGFPMATAVSRNKLMSALGLQPIKRFGAGDQSNLDTDGRLNSTDSVANLNTGMRALERTDETWKIPTDVEIAEQAAKDIKEAIQNLSSSLGSSDSDSDSYSKYGRGRSYYRSGYGSRGYSRSGGGSSYFTRSYTPPRANEPYANDISFINVSNPIIRRASIRRERFSSDRGRLNQWQ